MLHERKTESVIEPSLVVVGFEKVEVENSFLKI